MININDLKKRFEFVSNLTQQGGVGPDRFNQIAKYGHYSLFLERLGIPEMADFSSAIPKVAYPRTKKIHFDLEPFKDKRVVTLSGGLLQLSQLPEDCHITNIRAVSYIKEISSITATCDTGCSSALTPTGQSVQYRKATADIDIIDEARWSYRTKSKIIKTDFCCPYSTYLEFFFHSPIDAVEVTYLKKPVTPVWNYTIVNDEPVYQATGSVHLEWNELLMDSVVRYMVKEYSKYTSDQQGAMYADAKIANGQ